MLALTKSTTKQNVPHISLLGFSKFISPVIRRLAANESISVSRYACSTTWSLPFHFPIAYLVILAVPVSSSLTDQHWNISPKQYLLSSEKSHKLLHRKLLLVVRNIIQGPTWWRDNES